MCDDAVWGDLFSLQFVPDWFITQDQIKLWHDYDDYCNDDYRLYEWYDGYKKRRAQKAKKKRRINEYCLASITVVELVCA